MTFCWWRAKKCTLAQWWRVLRHASVVVRAKAGIGTLENKVGYVGEVMKAGERMEVRYKGESGGWCAGVVWAEKDKVVRGRVQAQ